MRQFPLFKFAVACFLWCIIPGASPAITRTVTMANFSYTPSTVTIGVGDTIIWNNTALGAHTTESSVGATCTASTTWDSTNINGGASFSITFTNYAAGTYNYMCRITTHCSMGMKGVIIITNVVAGNQPPMVNITSPTDGTVFASPASVAIQASASDDGSVTNVQFRVGTTVITNDTVAPYTAATNLPAGTYTLTAIAYDDLGVTATNSINITVEPAPNVNITSPSGGTVFLPPANVTIQANAMDDGTVSGVLFQVDGNNLTNDVTSPYTGITNNLAPGSHTLSAIATDNLGLKSTNSINITVDSLPGVTITNPVSGTVFLPPASVLVQARATDLDGTIGGVQFFVGANALTNDISAPFSAITNLNPGSYTLTAIATDNSGGTATNSVNIIVDALPTISITNPVAGTSFRASTNLVLYASVTDSDGTVTNVQFFSAAVSLGNVTNNIAAGNFRFTNINLSAGNYIFTAIARDNFGGATTSAAVNVFLLTNSAVGAPSHLPNGQTVFTLSGIAGQSYTTEASSNLFNWFPLFTNTAPANVFNVTDFTSTNALQRFYRTRQDF